MTVSRYELHFVHENKPYKISLHEGGEEKICIQGRKYGVNKGEKIPECADELFKALTLKSIGKENKLLKKVGKVSQDLHIEQFSIIKQTYEEEYDTFISKDSFHSEETKAQKERTYNDLIGCSATDKEQIAKIVQNSNLPAVILFEIADEVKSQKKDVELAHAIREAARPFPLEESLKLISEQIVSHHFDEEKAKEFVGALYSKFNDGAYEDIYDADEFAFQLQGDLRNISNDLHFEVLTKREEEFEISDESEFKRLQTNGFGFGEIEELKEEKALLLEIHKFENPNFTFEGKQVSREKAVALLDKIKESNPETIILDLRKHSGGSGYMSELFCSYFNEENIPLCSYKYGKHEPEESHVFPKAPTETWSYDRLPKEKRILQTPIFILTSHDTLSAAEDFTCHLKELNPGRVKVIGETTAGGAHINKLFAAGKDFVVAVPIGELVVSYPTYNRNWEGTGITPHVPVKANQALIKAESLLKSS